MTYKPGFKFQLDGLFYVHLWKPCLISGFGSPATKRVATLLHFEIVPEIIEYMSQRQDVQLPFELFSILVYADNYVEE